MDDHGRYSLLAEPLFRIRDAGGAQRDVSLPEVLAGLVQDEIVSFEALQAHQQQAWHCFLAQLAAMALARAGREGVPTELEDWRKLILALTDGEETPWCLVVEDLARPAFMQPPVPEGSLETAGYTTDDVGTPDGLDLLVTAKNHDVKMCRVARPEPQHWAYALVNLQTMQGVLGRNNYGIARMNKGLSNRPLVAVTPGLDWGSRFRRDVAVLMSVRSRIVDSYDYDPDGVALLWMLPWDGGTGSGLRLDQCDPYFIEVCRRIRFTAAEGRLTCWRAVTAGPRLADPGGRKGVTGDIWTPIENAGHKALTVPARGFSYDLLRKILLSGDYQRPAALERPPTDADGTYLLATTIVRGQGKTDGLHRRVVPIPQRTIHLFEEPAGLERLAGLARSQVEDAHTVQGKALYPALCALLTAGVGGSVESARLRRWLDAFDAAVDDAFFPHLWRSLDVPDDEARRSWQQLLLRFARRQLDDAIGATPLPSVRRYRAISAAESIFQSRARAQLPALFTRDEKEQDHERAASR